MHEEGAHEAYAPLNLQQIDFYQPLLLIILPWVPRMKGMPGLKAVGPFVVGPIAVAMQKSKSFFSPVEFPDRHNEDHHSHNKAYSKIEPRRRIVCV